MNIVEKDPLLGTIFSSCTIETSFDLKNISQFTLTRDDNNNYILEPTLTNGMIDFLSSTNTTMNSSYDLNGRQYTKTRDDYESDYEMVEEFPDTFHVMKKQKHEEKEKEEKEKEEKEEEEEEEKEEEKQEEQEEEEENEIEIKKEAENEEEVKEEEETLHKEKSLKDQLLSFVSSISQELCIGCRYNCANQEAHMDFPFGCLLLKNDY